MLEATVPMLIAWVNFYVIIGAAAATLTGLMFVVITLIVGVRQRATDETNLVFGTPTIVHFGGALLIATIFGAPWPALWNLSLMLGLIGLGGVLYLLIIIRRMRRQTMYKPVLEDWVWYAALPLIAYTVLLVTAVTLLSNPTLILFIVGAVAVLLLFIGIHNSWDTVTYIATENIQSENQSQD